MPRFQPTPLRTQRADFPLDGDHNHVDPAFFCEIRRNPDTDSELKPDGLPI
jgi:hypothetical protein